MGIEAAGHDLPGHLGGVPDTPSVQPMPCGPLWASQRLLCNQPTPERPRQLFCGVAGVGGVACDEFPSSEGGLGSSEEPHGTRWCPSQGTDTPLPAILSCLGRLLKQKGRGSLREHPPSPRVHRSMLCARKPSGFPLFPPDWETEVQRWGNCPAHHVSQRNPLGGTD